MDRLMKILSWRELALRFLDSHNPQPERAIVVAHAILEWDGDLGDNMRHHAHGFAVQAVRIIEGPDYAAVDTMPEIERWLIRWKAANL